MLAVVCIALVGLSASLGIYVQQKSSLQNKDKQIVALQNQLDTPKIISIGLQYVDNRSDANAPFLQVTGYVVNAGSAKANNCAFYIIAIQNGNVTALDTSVGINSLDAGTYETINVQFPYAGQPLIAYSSYLSCTN